MAIEVAQCGKASSCMPGAAQVLAGSVTVRSAEPDKFASVFEAGQPSQKQQQMSLDDMKVSFFLAWLMGCGGHSHGMLTATAVAGHPSGVV